MLLYQWVSELSLVVSRCLHHLCGMTAARFVSGCILALMNKALRASRRTRRWVATPQ